MVSPKPDLAVIAALTWMAVGGALLFGALLAAGWWFGKLDASQERQKDDYEG